MPPIEYLGWRSASDKAGRRRLVSESLAWASVCVRRSCHRRPARRAGRCRHVRPERAGVSGRIGGDRAGRVPVPMRRGMRRPPWPLHAVTWGALERVLIREMSPLDMREQRVVTGGFRSRRRSRNASSIVPSRGRNVVAWRSDRNGSGGCIYGVGAGACVLPHRAPGRKRRRRDLSFEKPRRILLPHQLHPRATGRPRGVGARLQRALFGSEADSKAGGMGDHGGPPVRHSPYHPHANGRRTSLACALQSRSGFRSRRYGGRPRGAARTDIFRFGRRTLSPCAMPRISSPGFQPAPTIRALDGSTPVPYRATTNDAHPPPRRNRTTLDGCSLPLRAIVSQSDIR